METVPSSQRAIIINVGNGEPTDFHDILYSKWFTCKSLTSSSFIVTQKHISKVNGSYEWFFLVNQKHKKFDSYEHLLLINLKKNKKQNIEFEQWSLIPELMTLMSWFFLESKTYRESDSLTNGSFLVNHKYSVQPVKYDSEANGSHKPVKPLLVIQKSHSSTSQGKFPSKRLLQMVHSAWAVKSDSQANKLDW